MAAGYSSVTATKLAADAGILTTTAGSSCMACIGAG
jgi:hypothetical protein